MGADAINGKPEEEFLALLLATVEEQIEEENRLFYSSAKRKNQEAEIARFTIAKFDVHGTV